MTTPTTEATGRTGIALALSGGGFRATLFHLGALRRLNELGVLSKVDTISSVSGGSLMSACLARVMMESATPSAFDFSALEKTVYDLVSYNLRRRILLKRVLPWNWGTSLPELVAKELSKHVTDKSLADLPSSPQFVFCATDLVFGVNWIYSRDRAGDWQAGYRSTAMNAIPIAHAAAASACFPPVFSPMPTMVASNELRGGDARGADADECRSKIRLCDGGVYDNMGLEPVWKSASTLLVSDAGGPFEFDRDRGTLNDVKRYPDIMGNQARALRKRWLIASFVAGAGPEGGGAFDGTYWESGGVRSHYDKSDASGYGADVAKAISHIRTDLNEFSAGEQAILVNQGYLMTDVAIKVHVSHLYDGGIPVRIPFPEWMDTAKVLVALKDSAHQSL